LNRDDEFRKAKEAALRLLALRDRSRKEVEGRLIEKGYTREIVDQILRELEFLGYIEDRRYALKFASDAVRRKNAGPAAIRYGLQQKGIPGDIIEETVSKVFQENDEKEVAARALRKRLEGDQRDRTAIASREAKDVPPIVDRQGFLTPPKGSSGRSGRDEAKKLFDYLRRKGFSYDIIRETLKEIEKEDDI